MHIPEYTRFDLNNLEPSFPYPFYYLVGLNIAEHLFNLCRILAHHLQMHSTKDPSISTNWYCQKLLILC